MLRHGTHIGAIALTFLIGLGAEASWAATAIPKGFLLTEARATAPQSEDDRNEMWWTVSSRMAQPLEVNPCGAKKYGDGRTAMRTIRLKTSAPASSSEQLVLYKSVNAAKAALDKLRTDVRRCAKGENGYRYSAKPLRIGDDAVWVKYSKRTQKNELHGSFAAVARRGKALIIYTRDGGSYTAGSLTGPAKTMAAKVCKISGVCA
ncbi:hypothetical protein GCM10010517_49620 [Streptosporangium fragile]|uniref:PknH-like extracellular domain-containing protein n=1 Tax=Streptosporangium fragile TaxID=46186 RepID=A0ABN3W2Q7_9ACTN